MTDPSYIRVYTLIMEKDFSVGILTSDVTCPIWPQQGYSIQCSRYALNTNSINSTAVLLSSHDICD